MEFKEAVFDKFPVLETKDLLLREMLLSDSEEVFEVFSSAEAMKYFGKHPFKEMSEAVERINQIRGDFQNKVGIRWGICFKSSDKLIGSVGIWRIDRKHFRGEIGYELSPKQWGKGIMLEPIKLVVDFGFHKMNLHTIEANTDPGNIASTKILEKSGFKNEGRTTESYYFDGEFTDTVIYSIVNKR